MAQLTYSYATPQAVAGGIADISDFAVESRMNEAADGVLGFGMGVVVGTVPGETVKVPTATTDIFEGVVTNGFTTEHDLTGDVVLRQHATVGCLSRGKIWVKVAPGQTVTYGADAYVAATGDNAGCFVTSGGILVGKFMSAVTTTTDADIALVDVIPVVTE